MSEQNRIGYEVQAFRPGSYINIYCNDGNGYLAAQVDPSCFLSFEEAVEEANLLVKARNTHYQLVAALEAVKRDIVPEFLEDHPGSYRALHLMDDALKAAKEQP